MVVGDLQDLQGILPGILHAQLTADTVEKRETPTLKVNTITQNESSISH